MHVLMTQNVRSVRQRRPCLCLRWTPLQHLHLWRPPACLQILANIWLSHIHEGILLIRLSRLRVFQTGCGAVEKGSFHREVLLYLGQSLDWVVSLEQGWLLSQLRLFDLGTGAAALHDLVLGVIQLLLEEGLHWRSVLKTLCCHVVVIVDSGGKRDLVYLRLEDLLIVLRLQVSLWLAALPLGSNYSSLINGCKGALQKLSLNLEHFTWRTLNLDLRLTFGASWTS